MNKMKIKKKAKWVAIWLIDWIDEENDLIGPYEDKYCENGFVRYFHANAFGKTFGDAAKAAAAEIGVSTGSTFLLYDHICESDPRPLTEDECAKNGVEARPGNSYFLGNFETGNSLP